MKRCTIDGVDLATIDRGAGRTIVLVHGFPLDHRMWTAQIEALAGRHRVVAPDLRGFGASAARGDTATMERFADDLAGLLEALEIAAPVVLCGLSMGGYIALAFARKYADRLAALVLCDTRAAADTAEAAAGRRKIADEVLANGSAALAESMLPKLLAPATLESRPEVVAAVRAMIASSSREGIAAAQRGMAERPDSTALLPQIGCPVLALAGEHDALSPPAEMQGMTAAMPRARFVAVPGAGHLAPMENGAAVNAAITSLLAEL